MPIDAIVSWRSHHEYRAVNVAATHAVASELARRNIRPHGKRIGPSEFHYETAAGATVYVLVAGKQDRQWPLIELPATRGGADVLVLVDFEGKAPPGPDGRGASARPDFYVLGREDWDALTATLGDWRAVVDGRAYYTLEPRHVEPYRERWDHLPR